MSESLRDRVAVRAGARWYGVPVEQVEEVIRAPERVSGVPGAPRWLRGVANSRGRLLALLDLACCIDADTQPGTGERVALVSRGSCLYGFAVDEVGDADGSPAQLLDLHRLLDDLAAAGTVS